MPFIKGHIVSEEMRKKISEKTREAMKNPEIRKKISLSRKGRKMSKEQRKNLSLKLIKFCLI